MADELKMTITTAQGITDVSQLVDDVTWSGHYNQCARTLEFGLLSPVFDKNVPQKDCPPGSEVRFYRSGALLFSGTVITRARDPGGETANITAWDKGFYLMKNEDTMAVKNQTPEEVAAAVCKKFGITPGKIAATGVKLSRNFLPSSGGANKLYNIIQTMYTLASEKTGKRYMVRFSGDSLDVVEKSLSKWTLVLRAGSNLLTASVTDSIENTVNQVLVYDKNDKLLSTKKDEDSISSFGRLQGVIKRGDKDKSADELAKKELEDNGLSQKITVTDLGNTDCIAGGTVVVDEPVTGLKGVFWIDEDYHYWKKGQYTDKLVLDYKCLMDEQSSGSEK